MKASERAHQHHAHQKNAQSRNTDMIRGTQITVASSADERMAASQVEQSPQHAALLHWPIAIREPLPYSHSMIPGYDNALICQCKVSPQTIKARRPIPIPRAKRLSAGTRCWLRWSPFL